MLRVLIADDHTLIRQGLRNILERHGDIQVVAEASNAAELMEQLRRTPPDVVVLDITMPGRSGLDALGDLRHTHRELPVLILSMHPEEQFAVRALRSGAAGYLTKDIAAEELVRAIRVVCSGSRYLSPDLARKLALHLVEDSEGRPHERLSDREHEVLRLLASGKTITEVGQALSLSVKTVSTYRTRILQKLRLESTAALIRYALGEGLAG